MCSEASKLTNDTEMAGPDLQKHVFIVGHGRSGTNMVLDLFDCHRNTFCRNEPNELRGTAFAGLGDPMFATPDPALFEIAWRKAVAQTIRSSGARDRFATDKDFFRSELRARLGQWVMARGRLRALMVPQENGETVEEWLSPALYYDSAALARALPVLKMLLAPAWISHAHALVDTQHVVHVIRRPEGFVQSWWSRYVTGVGGGAEKVFADNQPSLRRILAHFDRPAEMPEHYSLEALVTSELWRWRYMNEVMLAQLARAPRYLKLAYEDVMADKPLWGDKIYAFAGLEMTPDCRQQIDNMQNTLFGRRKPDGLDPALVAGAVETVLHDSPWRAQLAEGALLPK